MTSPGEAFVVELGRASKRGRWLVRNLQRTDRDDVLAAAMLWCWENRNAFTEQLSAEEPLPLDEWFAKSVSRAKRAWRNGEVRHAHASLTDIPVPDDTEARAAVEFAARELVRLITPEQRRIAIMQAKGYSVREITEKLDVDIDKVRSTRSTLRKLQELLPGTYEVTRVLRTEIAPPSDKPAVAVRTSIDTEIEQFGRPQLGGAPDFADDYVQHKRQYVASEDIRGRRVGYMTVADYEEDGPARRLLMKFDTGESVWMTVQWFANIYVPEEVACLS